MKSIELTSFLKSLTIAIPLVIGVIRFKKIDESYYPFLVYLLVGLITEVITFIFFVLPNKSNAALSNIYVLIEWLLVLWQFYSWRLFKKRPKMIFLIAVSVAGVWLIENIVYGGLTKEFSPFFRVSYSFILIIISINFINNTIFKGERNLLKNSKFLICLSFIVVFIYKLLYEGSYNYLIAEKAIEPRRIITAAFGYVNAFQKLLLIVAVLFIPDKKEHQL